jgi:hypothetical protein
MLVLSILVFGSLAAAAARADDVTATISSGTLKLKGDVDPNTLTLDQVGLNPDQVRVTGTTTTINGAVGPVVFDGFTGGLQVDLGAGDDSLTLNTLIVTGTVKIKMGAGANTVAITTSTFDTAVSIDLGSGDNMLQFCTGSVGAGLTVKVGAGTGVVRTATCGTSVATVPGSALVIDAVSISKGLTLKGSKMSEKVILNNLTIGGKTTLTLGGGSDAVAVCSNTINDALSIKMGSGTGTMIDASCASSTVSGENALDVDACSIHTKFTAKMGGAADHVLLKDDTIDESAKLDLGQGANSLVMDSNTVKASLGVKSGKGGDVVQITNGTISDNLAVSAGDGNNTVDVLTTDIGKNLTVKTGKNDDTIDVSTATVHGSTTIKSGKGTDTVIQ